MPRIIKSIQGPELDALFKEVKESTSFKLLFNEVNGSAFDISTKTGSKSNLDGQEYASLRLGLNNDKIIIVSTKTPVGIVSTASIVEFDGEKEIITGYRVVGNQIQIAFSEEHNEAFKGKYEKPWLDDISSEMVELDAVCLYGNWCGPGCSGPAAPIDGLDACCQTHDQCYITYGWFNCDCDRALMDCVFPYTFYIARAAAIYGWISQQWVNNGCAN